MKHPVSRSAARWLYALAVVVFGASAEAQRAPQAVKPSTPGLLGAGTFLRAQGTFFPGVDARGLRVDAGLMFRPLPRLAFDVGIGLGGGALRRPLGDDGFTEMAVALDLRVFANPGDAVQVFATGGVGLGGMGASLQSRPPVLGEECPGDAMFFVDLSVGGGFEWALGRSVSLTAWARAVHRTRLGGDLTFTASQVNPPLVSSDEAWGASAGLSLLLYLRP